ncbi:PAS domain S-box-containing protein/diguanylate cyclase (GGDEF)-like protein [Herbihabitans rhizosphaerae]|uniref:PAS domain S-box-containing protein/diguanylate cyclase (GGDEF)-like protein n=1 Tax=Herbihabitans rhizosphaerae TaxID=1872711 RepID=A0A4Q7KHK9_9PSEU|nr:EAL domain-containing protein [Herbihabitans rhizosphaerae]RZS34400.1 PAS domain S-box-containing protein/diguanylate cyclase (GGDEF)-like protein [Herbihabitans rhizosphaerae]
MDRADLVRRWAGTLSQIMYVPTARDEIERDLLELLDLAVVSLVSDQSPGQAGETIGERLIKAHFTKPAALRSSAEFLGGALPALPELSAVEDVTGRVVALIGGIASGYTESMRMRIFDQQEDVKQALVRAKRNVERDLKRSEARFREVFTSSAIGIAISDLDGRLVQTNAALARILAYRHRELGGMSLLDLFDESDIDSMRRAYGALANGEMPNFRGPRTLRRRDGEPSWVILSASMLRDADDSPGLHVTMVEDVSDTHLLQIQLNQQALHDSLTRLPNRHALMSRLERLLGAPAGSIDFTVFQMDLDAFTVVNDSLGHDAGDKLLRVVADRLSQAFPHEDEGVPMVARLGGDEFAIIMENTPTSPDVQTVAATINDELAEPTYIGGNGVAVSASIGVVQRPVGIDASEVLRRTDITLRRVKASGRRQWALFDKHKDAEDRVNFRLAATMPGAWEMGELAVEYQPMVTAQTRVPIGVQALLRWDHPERGAISHDSCVEVVADTGLSIPIGRWMLGEAAGVARSWQGKVGQASPPLVMDLSKHLASDPDLVKTLRGVLHESGLSAPQVQLGLPVQSLCKENTEAEENLKTLRELGVATVLTEFGTTGGDLACIEDLDVGAVKLAPRIVSRIASRQERGQSSFVADAMVALVKLVRARGASVIVPDIVTEAQLEWWREAGADIVQGPLLKAPTTPTEIADFLTT